TCQTNILELTEVERCFKFVGDFGRRFAVQVDEGDVPTGSGHIVEYHTLSLADISPGHDTGTLQAQRLVEAEVVAVFVPVGVFADAQGTLPAGGRSLINMPVVTHIP